MENEENFLTFCHFEDNLIIKIVAKWLDVDGLNDKVS